MTETIVTENLKCEIMKPAPPKTSAWDVVAVVFATVMMAAVVATDGYMWGRQDADMLQCPLDEHPHAFGLRATCEPNVTAQWMFPKCWGDDHIEFTRGAWMCMGTRSTGANSLTNLGSYFNASGGQVDTTLYTDHGDVILNQLNGTTTLEDRNAAPKTVFKALGYTNTNGPAAPIDYSFTLQFSPGDHMRYGDVELDLKRLAHDYAKAVKRGKHRR